MICWTSPSIKIPHSSVLTITHSFLRQGDTGECGHQSHVSYSVLGGSWISHQLQCSSSHPLLLKEDGGSVAMCVLREPCILSPHTHTALSISLSATPLSFSPLNAAITSMLYEQCLENRVKQSGMMWWTEYTTWIRRAVGRQCHLFVLWIEQGLSFLGTCFLSCKMDMMVCPRELVRIKWVQRFKKKKVFWFPAGLSFLYQGLWNFKAWGRWKGITSEEAKWCCNFEGCLTGHGWWDSSEVAGVTDVCMKAWVVN